jgi:hypothetical protein
MKKLVLLMMFFNITFYSIAQNQQDSCGTPEADSAFLTTLPWFGNNTFLINLRDSLHNANSCNNCRVGYEGGVNNYIYQIPVRVIIFYDATHRALEDNEIQWYINEVNRLYHESGLRVHLYLDCSVYREYNSIKAVANWADLWAASMSSERLTNRLNISLVHAGSKVNITNGIGPYPWLQDKYGSAIAADGTNPFTNIWMAQQIAVTMAHEIGHTLGLLHTFHKNKPGRTDCFQECVSRTRTQENKCLFTLGKLKCSVNGDCLCDTDADVEDLENNNNANCVDHTYDVSSNNTFSNDRKFDNYGDQWYKPSFTNAMDNLMSYWDCAETLTAMQQGVMYYYISKASSTFKKNEDVDFYENDNFYQPNVFNNNAQNQNIFNLNTKQYHTFHHNFNPTTACDVDWVYFQNNTSTAKPYVIQTQEVTGKPKPDTKITLFAINGDGTLGAQIATNDDISGTNLFSKLTTSNLAAFGRFALRIENKVTNVNDTRSKGHYFLCIDACFDKTNVAIIGDNSICSGSKQYSVSNLPVGAAVSWQATGCATVNSTGLVTKTGDCKTTLKATITACGETYEVTRDIIVGLPVFGDPGNAVESDFECSGGSNAQCYSSGPNGTVSWTTSTNMSNFTSVSWSKAWSIPANPGGSIIWSANSTGNTNGVNVHFKSANKSLALKTTLTNTCGSVEKYYCFYSTAEPCPAPMMMMMSGGNQTLKVYPNPTSTGNTITLELFLEEEQINFENSTIQLLDSKNKVVFEKMGTKEMKEQVDIPNISNGTYFISITNSNGTVSEELIINRGQ